METQNQIFSNNAEARRLGCPVYSQLEAGDLIGDPEEGVSGVIIGMTPTGTINNYPLGGIVPIPIGYLEGCKERNRWLTAIGVGRSRIIQIPHAGWPECWPQLRKGYVHHTENHGRSRVMIARARDYLLREVKIYSGKFGSNQEAFFQEHKKEMIEILESYLGRKT